MELTLLILAIALSLVAVILLLVLLFRKKDDQKELLADQLKKSDEILYGVRSFQQQLGVELQRNREETNKSLSQINTRVIEMQEINSNHAQKQNDTLRETVTRLQESNEKKLDQMRQTVDEKLTSTLSQRLESSFKVVDEQLRNVHKSLGEMKELAGDVNDLQRVLTNVKARGTWAEVQLGNLLEQTLTKEQYDCNVSIKGDGNRVEYAVKIPSRDEDGTYIWLPIDSKFPQEDYLRIIDAADRADKEAVENAAKALENSVKVQAQKISRLYLDVPKTTDFAIMFLATEGLYAEVLRRPGLTEEIQNKYRILICGPMTITAFLNTLRMGFRTIALDKRAADVWKVLGAVKSQYDTFEAVLAKAKKKIDEAGNTLEDAQNRNNIIIKKLRTVDEIEPGQADTLLGIDLPRE